MLVHKIILNSTYRLLIDELFFTLVMYTEVSAMYAIIAKDIFVFVLTYTPLIREWFISQIFTKNDICVYD